MARIVSSEPIAELLRQRLRAMCFGRVIDESRCGLLGVMVGNEADSHVNGLTHASTRNRFVIHGKGE